jgi:DNA/RNA endonuclease YhcR with UshA esterase domain
MRTIIAVICLIFILIAMPANVEGIRISSIDDAYIGEEVAISGVVITISSNVETCNVHTYEPGDTSILTIDDGSGTIRVCGDTRLSSFQAGERLLVSGIYAGGGIIYADKLRSSVEHGYKDISVAELKGFPEYYYDHSVRVKGQVKRIELTPEKTNLKIEDGTGTIDVEYRGEIEDIRINEEVIAEGKFYRNMIYAFSVKATAPTLTPTPTPAPTPMTTPLPTPTPAPTPTPTPTPLPTPAPTLSSSNTGLSSLLLYLLLICASVIIGVFSFLKLRHRRG